jgi:hypothetical protein
MTSIEIITDIIKYVKNSKGIQYEYSIESANEGIKNNKKGIIKAIIIANKLKIIIYL